MSNDPMVARDQLKSIVERIERMEDEKKEISDDIRDVYKEAKSNGFDVKVLRQVVSLRKKDLTERQEEEAVRDLYLVALGMLPDLVVTFDEMLSRVDGEYSVSPSSAHRESLLADMRRSLELSKSFNQVDITIEV